MPLQITVGPLLSPLPPPTMTVTNSNTTASGSVFSANMPRTYSQDYLIDVRFIPNRYHVQKKGSELWYVCITFHCHDIAQIIREGLDWSCARNNIPELEHYKTDWWKHEGSLYPISREYTLREFPDKLKEQSNWVAEATVSSHSKETLVDFQLDDLVWWNVFEIRVFGKEAMIFKNSYTQQEETTKCVAAFMHEPSLRGHWWILPKALQLFGPGALGSESEKTVQHGKPEAIVCEVGFHPNCLPKHSAAPLPFAQTYPNPIQECSAAKRRQPPATHADGATRARDLQETWLVRKRWSRRVVESAEGRNIEEVSLRWGFNFGCGGPRSILVSTLLVATAFCAIGFVLASSLAPGA